ERRNESLDLALTARHLALPETLDVRGNPRRAVLYRQQEFLWWQRSATGSDRFGTSALRVHDQAAAVGRRKRDVLPRRRVGDRWNPASGIPEQQPLWSEREYSFPASSVREDRLQPRS